MKIAYMNISQIIQRHPIGYLLVFPSTLPQTLAYVRKG